MEKLSKKELLETVEKQREQLAKCENQLRDVMPAHKSLIKEKEALEASLKALTVKKKQEVAEYEESRAKSAAGSPSAEVKKDMRKPETVEQLRTQLGVLMNSLATLSAEKSRMEANFQSDKKQLRNERDECEKVIKDLKEMLKHSQKHTSSEVEYVKYKLIMERHDREKEQADHSAMIKELQRLVNDERRAKEQLESKVIELKNQAASKTQNKVLEAELEIARNKLKQAEAAAKETPPLLLSLQIEMANMKRQHRNAIQEEQKRAAAAEQQARVLAMTHETRVAGLEARLAELSDTVGGYDRSRQQDQQAIHKLKEQLITLQDMGHKGNESSEFGNDPEEIAAKIRKLYAHLMDLGNRGFKSSNIKTILSNLNLRDVNEDLQYREKYESLYQEFEDYKQQMMAKLRTSHMSNVPHKENSHTSKSEDKVHTTKSVQLHLAKTHNRNLEERIRMLNAEIASKEKECKVKLEHQQQLIQEERINCERALSSKDNEFRGRIAALEQQLLRQRERSLSLIQEKDHEIQTLKASFHAILPKKGTTSSPADRSKSPTPENASEPATDLVTGLLTSDSPPMLHYAQELARREVEVSSLRKSNIKLEAELRENQREFFHALEKHREEVKVLQAQITRLEACKSREGANLEYLKNVFLNYIITNDSRSKRHMLNAISTVLRFTPEEIEKIHTSK